MKSESGAYRDTTRLDLPLFGRIIARLEHMGPGVDVRAAILGDVMRLVGGDFAASYVWDAGLRRFERACSVNMNRATLELYETHYQFDDPITLKLRARRRATDVHEILPYPKLYHTEFFNDFLRRDGLHHGVNMYLFDNNRDLGDLRIWRAKGRPDFAQREIDILDALEPFLRKAIIRTTLGFEQLTERERDVACLVARGCTDRDIASILGIGFATVRTHLNSALRKQGCSNRAELAAK
ncbi:MAG: helix-turn-helix transcriptional regulator, partial [Pseudolabrys sp.]